jgi:hypothetical protein
MIAAAIKHRGFVAEEEWRFVGLGGLGTDHCFRAGRSGIVPFHRIHLCEEDQGIKVNKVVIGPTGDPAAAEMAVGTMLWFYADNDPIEDAALYRVTQTPYRV